MAKIALMLPVCLLPREEVINLFLALLMGIVLYAAGLYAGASKSFPYGPLVLLWRRFRPSLPKLPDGPPEQVGVHFVLEIESQQELQARRRELIRYLWNSSALPASRLPDKIESNVRDGLWRRLGTNITVDRWHVEMDFGINSIATILSPTAAVHRTTIVYHQGHEGSIGHGRHIIELLLKRGFRVVGLSMPLLEPNRQPNVTFRRHGEIALLDHDFLALLEHEYGVHPVRYFVEPVIACVNQIRATSDGPIAMLGISGGGWTTTLSAAVDDRLALSFPVAGSLPFSLRRKGEFADFENHVPSLYEIANYPELHVLGACSPHRTQIQILNEFDTVAWSGRRGVLYERVVQEKLRTLAGGTFSVVIDSSHVGHRISRLAMKRILWEIQNLEKKAREKVSR